MSPLACPPAAGLGTLYRHDQIFRVSSVYQRVRQHYSKTQFCDYTVVGGLTWGQAAPEQISTSSNVNSSEIQLK